MADKLRVELSEAALAVGPGGVVSTPCTVYNTSLIVDEYQVRVTGIDPSWIDVPSTTARIFPEGFATITVQFQPPRSAVAAAGDYPFTITAISVDNPVLTASTSGILTVGPFVDFSFDLDSPSQLSGEIEGVFTVRVANLGNAQLTIGLEASADKEGLDFQIPDSPFRLDAGETRLAKVIAKPKTMRFDGTDSYQIDIDAVVTGVTPPAALPPDASRRTTVVRFQHIAGEREQPKLEPETIELTGQQAQTTVVIANRSALPVTMELAGKDKANALMFDFVGGNTVKIAAGETAQIAVRITCGDRTKLAAPPSSTPFTISATPVDPSGKPLSVGGELTQPGPADFRLQLVPETVESSAPERVQLTIENVSPRPATFTIQAVSKDVSLAIALGATQVDIGARDRMTIPVDLTPQLTDLAVASGARSCGFAIRVFPNDAPTRVNEVNGQYIITPATLEIRLLRKEIESANEGIFSFELRNPGKNEVSVVLEASDRAAACQYTFDFPRLRIPAQATAPIQLTVTPPAQHPPTARWQFEIRATPLSPSGPTIREEGLLIYRAPTVGLVLSPDEQSGRRSRKFNVILSNPTPAPIVVKLTATDRSGALALLLRKEQVELPPSGQGSQKVNLKVTPLKRQRGSAPAALTFNVAATPISPPGDAVISEGRLIALPPRSRWLWILLCLLLFVAFLFSPLYEQAFYVAGWERSRTYQGQTWSGEHHFKSDVKCVYRQMINGDTGKIRDRCFAQGPRPISLDMNFAPARFSSTS